MKLSFPSNANLIAYNKKIQMKVLGERDYYSFHVKGRKWGRFLMVFIYGIPSVAKAERETELDFMKITKSHNRSLDRERGFTDGD